MLLEVCCYNLASAMIAQESGAHRVELCADPADGGTTPSYSLIKTARKKLNIALYPIIRTRGGDFLFSDEEFEVMLHDVHACKKLGCDGVVIGILHANGTIDKEKCSRLVESAYPLGVTFHRAFDWSVNPFEALEDIIDIGCERILTSGQQPRAIQGAPLIADLIKQAADRIVIMPGSGIRASNIADLARETGAVEFHSSARINRKTQMQYLNSAMQEEQFTVMADRHEIEGMLKFITREANTI
ncbi:MAG: copper homeostasis protein CutC [Bacteroidetes bacterium]|nr:copper homeostasis protein CutC [Bacteroidota bacterium]